MKKLFIIVILFCGILLQQNISFVGNSEIYISSKNSVDMPACLQDYQNPKDNSLNGINNKNTLVFPKNSVTSISTNTIILDSITLKIENGAKFNILFGDTLTIQSYCIDAGLYQIFEGDGVVIFTNIANVYPEWWGAKPDYDTTHPNAQCTDNISAIKNAINSIQKYGCISFNGNYKIIDTLKVTKSNITFTGNNQSGAIYQTGTDRPAFRVKGDNITFDGLKIYGTFSNDLNAERKEHAGIDCSCDTILTPKLLNENITVKNCYIQDFVYGVLCMFNKDFLVENTKIWNIRAGIKGGVDSIHNQSKLEDSYKCYNVKTNVNRGICHNCDYDISTDPNNPYDDSLGLRFARGFYFLYTYNVTISSCWSRGGGMSVEVFNPTKAGYMDLSRNDKLIVEGCDFDGPISIGSDAIIRNNVIDWTQYPTNRTVQYDFNAAIEITRGIVDGNIIRDYNAGLANQTADCIVVNNKFYNNGRNYPPHHGPFADIIIGGAGENLDSTSKKTIICNNQFYNSNADNIWLNYQVAVDLTNGMGEINISNNIAYYTKYDFLQIQDTRNAIITNNILYCVSNADNGDWANGIIESGGNNANYYEGNIFINKSPSSFGMNHGLFVDSASVIGFNKFNGMRSDAIHQSVVNTTKFISKQLIDNVISNGY